jgi:hypothetical protein
VKVEIYYKIDNNIFYIEQCYESRQSGRYVFSENWSSAIYGNSIMSTIIGFMAQKMIGRGIVSILIWW